MSMRDQDHYPSDHTPIQFPWRTDLYSYGIDRAPVSMRPVGHLLRAARDGCDPCTDDWAMHLVHDDPLVITHLVGSSVSLTLNLGADPHQIYRLDTWSLITPMLNHDVTTMISVTDSLTIDQRACALEDALAVFSAPMTRQHAAHPADTHD